MTQTLTTLNISVQQIESDLRHGRTVQQIAQDWQEPVSNVLAVKRAMESAGERFAAPPKPPAAAAPVAAAGARPATSASTPDSRPAAAAPAGLSVDALVAAAARSTSKRTQVLGVKLRELTTVVRDRLADERRTAEAAERTRAEQEAAAAEVKRLEAELREAKAKLRPVRQGGVSPMPRDQKAADRMALAREAARGEFPCSKGCGKVSATRAGQLSHERSCAGAS